MNNRFLKRLKFYIERLILRGAKYQLILLAVTIILVSILGGAVAFIFTGDFKGVHGAIWWAFLRLTDPGYLGDDQGLFLRVVSVTLMILGYILFWGALVAIMTQWLYRTLRGLERGSTPITQKGHVLILGWTNRTLDIVKELLSSSERLTGSMGDIDVEDLRIVILAQEVTGELAQDLREGLGPLWDEKRVLLRSGDALRIEHLQRVDYMHAGVIIIPGTDFLIDGQDNIDARNIKSLLCISEFGSNQSEDGFPLVISEIRDARKIPIALSAYKGEVELISSDQVVSRLLVQSMRHQGLLGVAAEIINQDEGNEFFLREFPELTGKRLQDLSGAFPKAIVCGVLRPGDEGRIPILNPPDGFRIEKGDILIILAGKSSETDLSPGFDEEPVKKGAPVPISRDAQDTRVLIMGWNHNVPALINEFDNYQNEHFSVDVFSRIPVTEREDFISQFDMSWQNVTLRHLQGDCTVISELEQVSPASYDNVVLISDSLMKSNEESDALSILGFLTLKRVLSQNSGGPEILVQLMMPQNKEILQGEGVQILVSPLFLSRMVARVAVRRDLRKVFNEIFTAGGTDLAFMPAERYGIDRESVSFKDIEKAVTLKGDLALGVKINEKKGSVKKNTHLNPSRDSVWDLGKDGEIIVLTTSD